ncbi:unnamed protein product [Adineta ricciae]|uniref:Uncharacterized protein n=1 Tax=Adineta ricciae TaxID=249248 RepID=A0A815M0G6_ADIRI|nr:unnamed protein product [Adineta ricciae]CAF1410066.1 unnamed protein product [Adineta ricciae]
MVEHLMHRLLFQSTPKELTNVTEIDDSFPSYISSRYAAGIVAIIVYISLIAWFIHALYSKCHPRYFVMFILLSHLITFIELILRATLTNEYIQIYPQITKLLSILPPRFLLLSNYSYLAELRKSHVAFAQFIVLTIILFTDIFLHVINELSSQSDYLRQASAVLVFFLSLLFFLLWYWQSSHLSRFYTVPLLPVSSMCVLIEAIYVQMTLKPFLLDILVQNELYFYLGHSFPLVVALCTWSMYHPWRVSPLLTDDRCLSDFDERLNQRSASI